MKNRYQPWYYFDFVLARVLLMIINGNKAPIDFSIREYALNGQTNHQKANLIGANLAGKDLTGYKFQGADLRGANLAGANLSNADLSGADLRGAILTGANLSNSTCKGTNFSVDRKTQIELCRGLGPDNSGTFAKRTLQANSNMLLMGVNFSNADLRDANLSNTALANSNLSNVNLTNTNLSRADLMNANLEGAKLTNTNLIQTCLVRANLTKTTFTNPPLMNATDLREAEIPENLEEVIHTKPVFKKNINQISTIDHLNMLKNLCSTPNPKLPESPLTLFHNILKENDLLAIGEAHRDEEHKYFLAENISEFKKIGLTFIGLERHYEDKAYLAFENERMNNLSNAQNSFREMMKSRNENPDWIEAELAILTAAHENGVKIHLIDNHKTKFSIFDEDGVRASEALPLSKAHALRNQSEPFMANNIRKACEEGKGIIIVGSGHLSHDPRMKAPNIPNLTTQLKDLKMISVGCYTADPGEESRIYHDQQESSRTEENMFKTLNFRVVFEPQAQKYDSVPN